MSTTPAPVSAAPAPAPVLRPPSARDVPPRSVFTRGRERPRGVAWFGVRSFWGHLQHLVASAIATEDIDSRDWMTADEPGLLAERIARLLGAEHHGRTLTERLGADLWIDYIADTGDDVAVSRAVARLLFAPYEVPDPERPGEYLLAPRGDVLLFGGDTAYPVATADEIQSRVVAPFNQVLAERDDGKRRVILGIPGNHDWYDGLDGFGRLFRRHVFEEGAHATLQGANRTKVGRYAEFAVQFFRGGHVGKPRTLNLVGYTPAQSASYFLLPVAPHLPLLAVDRQLKKVDARQAFFFASFLNENVASTPWVVLPDPVYAFGMPSPTGVDSINALGLSLTGRPHLVMSGDIHHYRRELEGPTLHVTAGGGGAFLHPAPLVSSGRRPAAAEWPTAAQSRSLLFQVPLKVMLVRSGLLPHAVFALLLFPLVWPTRGAFHMATFLAAWLMASAALALIGGARRRPAAVVLATALAAIICASCVALRYGFHVALPRLDPTVRFFIVPEVQLAVAAFVGAFLFGTYLVLLTLFGYENTQAFTALDHPGYKHFVRLRIRRDGSAIDGFCIGLVDPVKSSEGPLLVDSFTWKSRPSEQG
ncbi:MAG TPA: hypothetical protein VHU80_07595 [Polyangiaceae bacterium]|nr:hypothetical protein [Polyangiaceae bacterium]